MNIRKLIAITLYALSYGIPSTLAVGGNFIVSEIMHRKGIKFAIIQPIEGLSPGSTLQSFRALASYTEKSIPTGKMKIIQVNPTYALAEIYEDGSEFSKKILENHAYVMAGDQLELEKITIERDLILTEDVKLEYAQLFEDPNALPSTFELSEKGKELLRESVKTYLAAKISKIAILGFTDQAGNESVSRVESMQRAMTVRQFLIDDVRLDKSRIVSFGMGEEEIMDSANNPNSKQKNRRIEIRALNE